jgi:hypothetical protein
MDETPEQKYNRMADAVQQSILRNYPNPNREGCPGEAAVREVASRTAVRKDELWRHITHCSPCYAEFLKYRDAERYDTARRVRSRRSFLVAASLTVATVGGVSYVYLRQGQTYQVNWDLESQRTFRGLDEDRMEGPSGPPLSAPAAPLHINLTMPKGSPAGEYEIKFWKSVDQPSAFSRSIRVLPNQSTVTFDADLSGRSPGPYTLGVRSKGTPDWKYFPVIVTGS